jgi:cell division septum initiation protein DivIVA
MTTVSYSDMRRDLDHWEDEHVQWFRDVSHWQTEHQSALAEMHELERRCTEHGDAVRRHAEAIATQEERFLEHARRLRDEGVAGEREEELASSHQQLAEVRRQQRQAHERIRAHHLVTMAQLRMLVQAICAPM